MAKNRTPPSDYPTDTPEPRVKVIPDDLAFDGLAHADTVDDDPYAVLKGAPTLASVPHPQSAATVPAPLPFIVQPTPVEESRHVLPSMVPDAVRGLYLGPTERRELRMSADPLKLRTFQLLERLYYGGLLLPHAYDARESIRILMDDLRSEVCDTPTPVAPHGE